jgi:hypothetical protein
VCSEYLPHTRTRHLSFATDYTRGKHMEWCFLRLHTSIQSWAKKRVTKTKYTREVVYMYLVPDIQGHWKTKRKRCVCVPFWLCVCVCTLCIIQVISLYIDTFYSPVRTHRAHDGCVCVLNGIGQFDIFLSNSRETSS